MPLNPKQQKLFSKAVKKHKAQKYQEAESLYRKILKDSRTDADTHCMLGTLYAERGNTDSALIYLLQADKINGDSYLVKNNLGNVYKMIGEYEKANNYYQQAIALAPENVEAYNNLAIICKRQQNVNIAIDLYQKAIHLNSSFLEAHYNLGKLYSDAKDIQNALACYQRVLDINPNYAAAYNQLGDHYRSEQEFDKASEHYHRCLELADNDPYGVRMKLAYIENGQLPERSPDSVVVESYESKASSWDRDVNRATMEFLGPQIIHTELESLFAKSTTPDDWRILDLGCGTGLCGEYLKPLSSCLDGVDLSPHMLQVASKKHLYDNLHCKEIVNFLQNNKESYNLITASGVVIFFGDLLNIHKLINKRLDKSGLFIFTTYISPDIDVDVRSNLHFAHSENHLRHCAKQSGLDVISLQVVIHEYDYGEPQKGYVVTLKKS